MHISTSDYYSSTATITLLRMSRLCSVKPHSRLGNVYGSEQLVNLPRVRCLGSVCGGEQRVNLSHVVTCTPPVKPEKRRMSLPCVHLWGHGDALTPPSAVLNVGRKQAQVCRGSVGEEAALPTLGCLPDESYSKEDVRRGGEGVGSDWWWEVV